MLFCENFIALVCKLNKYLSIIFEDFYILQRYNLNLIRAINPHKIAYNNIVCVCSSTQPPTAVKAGDDQGLGRGSIKIAQCISKEINLITLLHGVKILILILDAHTSQATKRLTVHFSVSAEIQQQ